MYNIQNRSHSKVIQMSENMIQMIGWVKKHLEDANFFHKLNRIDSCYFEKISNAVNA